MTSPAAPSRLVLVGAGGHGRETLDVVEAINRHEVVPGGPPPIEVIGVVADLVDEHLLARRGLAHLGPADRLHPLLIEPTPEAAAPLQFHIAIGSGAVREHVDRDLRAHGGDLADRAASLVHPAATLGSDLRLAAGLFLAAGARITTNVSVGRHTHLNINAVISHDCEVGAYVTLSPGALVNGNVTLGDGVFLGTGAIVLPGRRVGPGAIVGAGAVVTRDVPAGVTASGVPARW